MRAGYSSAVTTWAELGQSAESCTRWDLYERATATVFGEGKTNAAMVLVGEQPGDQEDKQGRPFVGPAGRVLPGPGRQRHRPGRRLPDQRRQALQVDRARQAPDPPAPERHRDQGLQILAGGGTRFHPSPAARPGRRSGDPAREACRGAARGAPPASSRPWPLLVRSETVSTRPVWSTAECPHELGLVHRRTALDAAASCLGVQLLVGRAPGAAVRAQPAAPG